MGIETQNVLKYEFVQQEFEDVGECLKEDLSSVRVSMLRDIHTDSIDLEICIYGQDCDADSAPIVQHFYGESDILDIGVLKVDGTITPNEVLTFFDQDLLDLFIHSGIMIHWNEGDITFKAIDPVAGKNIGRLSAQDQ